MKQFLQQVVKLNRTQHQTSEANDRSFASQIDFEAGARSWESLALRIEPTGMNEGEKVMVKKNGYSIRLVPVPHVDRDLSLGNLTTHGFRLLNDHPDFQIVRAMSYPAARGYFDHLYNFVKAGKKFEDGEAVLVNEGKVKLTMRTMFINFVHVFRAIVTTVGGPDEEEEGRIQLEYCPPFQGICDDCAMCKH